MVNELYYGGVVPRYRIEWLEEDPAVVERSLRYRSFRSYGPNPGWYLIHTTIGAVARIGNDHGRFNTDDAALIALINFYPHRVFEARRVP